MSVFKVLIAPLLMVWWLPPAAQALWSPEPGHPPVIEQVSAFGPREEDPATLREDYVLPGESEQEEASGLLPGPDAAGRVREVIRTPDLPDQGRETYSRVDVAKVETADARAAQRKDAADALLSGVTIPEPAVLSLLAVGLLVLAAMSRPQRLGAWRRIFSSRDSASERSAKSSSEASTSDNSRSAS